MQQSRRTPVTCARRIPNPRHPECGHVPPVTVSAPAIPESLLSEGFDLEGCLLILSDLFGIAQPFVRVLHHVRKPERGPEQLGITNGRWLESDHSPALPKVPRELDRAGRRTVKVEHVTLWESLDHLHRVGDPKRLVPRQPSPTAWAGPLKRVTGLPLFKAQALHDHGGTHVRVAIE